MAASEASKNIEKYREKAEIYTGDDICRPKIIDFQAELGFPTGILRLKDIIEFGYNREAKFVWVLQKEKTEHRFKKAKTTVSYDKEITAFVEYRKIEKMTGIKSKELMIWISSSEMYISDPVSGKLHVKTYTGLGRTFPVSAFVLEDEVVEEEEEEAGREEVSIA